METPLAEASLLDTEEINTTVNYAMYAVFSINEQARKPGENAVASIEDQLSAVEDLRIRGWYDISGFRADSDFLVWFHAPNTEALQRGYRIILDGSAGRLSPVWSNIGIHRAAEFNREHVPAFLSGEMPKTYICVYPFVRSYDWYLLPEKERSHMLREHGEAARDFGDVLANTISSFALGDYEWLLAFEADDLVRIVDLMRELRAVDARLHVREEVPFFTGPRKSASEILQRSFV
ncbi:MAG: chlorite dismutase family protein [Microbacteriaceae bacterium]|nr:chlorite dismutase family protein [Microbacteriaceae bacterium]